MISCPNCHYQVQNEEIQCPYCLIVLKQLYCGNCNNILDLRYTQCIYCGQPYILPYQIPIQELIRQDLPEKVEQQHDSQPVSQFSFQASKSRRSSKNTSIKKEKQKGSIFDGDKPKGFKMMIWALKPSNGRTLTVRDNIKLIFMMLGCSVLALVVIIAGFNIKDKIDNNAAANERAQRLVAVGNTNATTVPEERVSDASSFEEVSLDSSEVKTFNKSIDELEVARERLLDKYADIALVSSGWEEQDLTNYKSTGKFDNGERMYLKNVYLNKSASVYNSPNLKAVYSCVAVIDSDYNIKSFTYTTNSDKAAYATENAFNNYTRTTPSIWIAALTGESMDIINSIFNNGKQIDDSSIQYTKNHIQYTINLSVHDNTPLYNLTIIPI